MKIETFMLERTQSLWENTVEYNLTETGIYPLNLEELLDEKELTRLQTLRLGYGQTNGSIELRDAISRLYPGTSRDNVLVTTGSAEANFVALCNPNNPTGAVLGDGAMKVIIELAENVDAWIYVDEIYRGAELSDLETPTFYGRYHKVMVAGGLSKAYALPGLRIGWLAGPTEAIAEAWSRRDYTTISTGILSNYIAALALRPTTRLKILERNRGILRENILVLKDWVEKQKDIFHFLPPRAGGMAFLKYDLDINSTELVTRIRKAKSTFIVAGDCFGMDHRVRIGIGSRREYLEAGLERISESLGVFLP